MRHGHESERVLAGWVLFRAGKSVIKADAPGAFVNVVGDILDS